MRICSVFTIYQQEFIINVTCSDFSTLYLSANANFIKWSREQSHISVMFKQKLETLHSPFNFDRVLAYKR